MDAQIHTILRHLGNDRFFPLREKIIAISFLFVLFAPVMTIYAYLQFEKSAIRREIKWKMIAGMDEAELVLLKFTKEETQTKLRWEHSKEFEYNGQMYDVVSTVVKGDSIFYRLWWDYEETELNKKLKRMVAIAFAQDEENREAQEILFTYLSSFFLNVPFEWQAKPSQDLAAIHRIFFPKEIFSTHQSSPPTPPPKLS